MRGLIIADDEQAVRSGLARNIRWAKYGFGVVVEADCGREAVRLIRSAQPDLLVTDIRMPDLSGLDVMMQARRIRPDLQIIVLSAYNSFEYAQQAMLHSAVGYLLKPIVPEQLDPLMEKVLRNLAARPAAPAPAADEPATIAELARRYIEQHYAARLTLEEVAGHCYTSASYLSTAFKASMGVSFVDYLTGLRMRKACELLERSSYRIHEIAAKTGYEDYTYFCKVFKKAMGVTPLAYRCKCQP